MKVTLLLPRVCAALAMLTAGCALMRQEYRPVACYDLRAPEHGEERGGAGTAPPLLPSLRIKRFETVSPQVVRMLYRKSDFRVALDEYNRWLQPPAELVTREFYRRFAESGRFASVLPPDASGTSDLALGGVLLALECDADLNANLRLTVTLEDVRAGHVLLNRFYRVREPLRAAEPEAFAEAASKALHQAMVRALADIETAVGSRPPTEAGN